MIYTERVFVVEHEIQPGFEHEVLWILVSCSYQLTLWSRG